MPSDETRRTVARLLRQSQAHSGLARALEGFPVEAAGRHVAGHQHTAWELLEHLRVCAEDLVAYVRDEGYAAPDWPADYWPRSDAPAAPGDWEESARRFSAATEAMAALVEEPERDLHAPLPSAEDDDHHLLRAALVLLDHNGYHAGQLVTLRRALGAWG